MKVRRWRRVARAALKPEGRRRRVSSLAWTAELFFVLAVPPLFLFYLMGWRPFTGKKE